MTHVGRAHVAAILVVAIGLLDLDLLPIDVELVRDDHGQRIPDALSGFRVLRHDCERVVGMNLDIGVGIDWRGRHRSRRASLLREEVGVGVEADHDSAAGQSADFNKGATIELFGRLHGALLCLSPAVGGEMNGFADPQIGPAATHVTGHCLIDIGIGWLRCPGQQRRGRHELSGLAVPALRYIQFQPRFLQRMRSVCRQAFDGRNRSVDRRDLRLASPSGLPANVYSARTALADSTSELRSLQVENVSQHPEKRHIWRYVYRLRLPVHRQFIGHTPISCEKD